MSKQGGFLSSPYNELPIMYGQSLANTTITFRTLNSLHICSGINASAKFIMANFAESSSTSLLMSSWFYTIIADYFS